MADLAFVGACITGITVTSYIVYQKYIEVLDEETSDNRIKYAFSKRGNPQELLEQVIENAEEKLDIAIFSITQEGIVDRIINATKKGVKVRLLTDKKQSKTHHQEKAIKKLLKSNIPVKVNKHGGLMHLKLTIADNKVFTTGSYNYSHSGGFKNDDVIVLVNEPKITGDWVEYFEALWKKATNIDMDLHKKYDKPA